MYVGYYCCSYDHRCCHPCSVGKKPGAGDGSCGTQACWIEAGRARAGYIQSRCTSCDARRCVQTGYLVATALKTSSQYSQAIQGKYSLELFQLIPSIFLDLFRSSQPTDTNSHRFYHALLPATKDPRRPKPRESQDEEKKDKAPLWPPNWSCPYFFIHCHSTYFVAQAMWTARGGPSTFFLVISWAIRRRTT